MSESELAKRFDLSNPKMEVWNRNEKTDVFVSPGSDNKVIKDFNRGGFKGKSANPTYVIKRLTAEFGPLGKGWGYSIVKEDYVEGEPIAKDGVVLCREVVHVLRILFWYKIGEDRCEFEQYGQTTFVSRTQHGPKTDEEAPKKSLTDAITKAASWLGFVADIHMGMWDDSKYVNNAVAVAEEDRAYRNKMDMLGRPYAYVNSKGDVSLSKDAAEWRDGWISRITALAKQDAFQTIQAAWDVNSVALESTRLVDPASVQVVEKAKEDALAPKDKAATGAGITLPPDKDAAAAPADSAPPPQEQPGDDLPDTAPQALAIWNFDAKTGEIKEYEIPKGKNKDEEVWLAAWRRAIALTATTDKIKTFSQKNERWLAIVTRFHPQIGDLARTALVSRMADLNAGVPGGMK